MNQNVWMKIALVAMASALAYILFVVLPQQKQLFDAQLQEEKRITDQASSTVNTAIQTAQASAETSRLEIEALSNKNTFASVIKKWGPKVAQIVCNFRDVNGNIYETSSGSATAVSGIDSLNNVAYGVLTNLHVLEDRNVSAADCDVKFQDDPNIMTILNSYQVHASENAVDAVALKIMTPDSYIINLSYDSKNKCQREPNLGDDVVILGYPGIGANRSITATEGIISGFEDGYYVTSAKVEHGNSGGVAILVKDNCALGLPTFVESGSVESLARILKWQMISLIQR